jgi:hypothetical protein
VKIHSPKPGQPSGMRAVMVLRALAVVIVIAGVAIAIGSAVIGRPILIATGIIEAGAGVVLTLTTRTMAKTERTLADLAARRGAS